MELLSTKESNQYKYGFPALWIGITLLTFIFTKFHWFLLIMLAVGVPFFAYALMKVKEVYDCGEFIKVKDGESFIDIPVSEIESPIERSSIIQGYYRINFKSDTPVGKHIVFHPRYQYLFFTHKAVKSFIQRVNT